MAMTFFKFPQGSAALTLVYGEKEDGRKAFFAADGRGGTPLTKIKPTHAAWALERIQFTCVRRLILLPALPVREQRREREQRAARCQVFCERRSPSWP